MTALPVEVFAHHSEVDYCMPLGYVIEEEEEMHKLAASHPHVLLSSESGCSPPSQQQKWHVTQG